MPIIMTSMDDLKAVPDDELLRRLSALLKQSRRVESVLIAHIAEVDARRLYIRDAASMFAYCTQVMHLSEHEAYARITAARAARTYPVLLRMLSDGRLHLSGIAKLVPHLTAENHAEVLARATHKTKGEIEELIAEIAPKPDVPPAVRMLPANRVVDNQLGPDRVANLQAVPLLPVAAKPAREPSPAAPPLDPPISAPPSAAANATLPAVTPLAPARYKVQFTASAELRDKLERLQALTRLDLAAVIEAAVSEKLERIEAKRFGQTKSPRMSLDEADVSPSSRYIPAPVRRIVRDRDGNRCTFINRNGSRCTERRRLEFHHREPYARGGTHSPDNVCVMCRTHNAYLAERDYGKEWMQQYRSRPDRVSEDAARYARRFEGSVPGYA
jgi:hypothetical protein